jgi:ABC-type multidrug transport system ATPase subunit
LELVYLWVEDYKNIKKQGFNFSPRFHCEYNDETKELTIDENDDYIPDFFGKNINVTAIVGKNGSGKTTVFKVIEDIWKRIGIVNNKYILCFYLNSKIYILTEVEFTPKINYNYEQITHDIEIQKFFYKNHLFINYPEILHYSQEEYYYKDKEDYEITFQESRIYEIIAKIGYQKLSLTTFMMLPETLSLEIRKEEQENILRLITPIEEVYYHDGEEYKYYCKNKFGDYLDIIKYYSDNNTGNLLEIYFVWKIIENGYLELFDNISIPKNEKYIEVLELDITKIINIINKYNLNPEGYSFQEFNFLREKNSFSLTNLTDVDSKLLRKYIKFFKFDYIDQNKSRYSELSQGEKIIYGQFLNILNFVESNDNVVILLDEPTNSFHPQWQKQYISELTQSFKRSAIHFIITSHTPFLLSDIPKQNIIFLDKDEKGNCKVVDGLKEKKQTFGANIHTLLSDSFFMDDGLMGAFAKSKIDKAITLLNQDKLDEKDLKYCEQIISIIGEPIVKNQLQRMLDSKRLKKVDEIDAIKKNMLKMQQRLDELEK